MKKIIIVGLLLLTSCSMQNNKVENVSNIEVAVAENKEDTNLEENTQQKASTYPKVENTNVDKSVTEYDLYSEGIFLKARDGEVRYSTLEGQIISNGQYDFGTPFSEGLACVSKDGKFGFIDTTGEVKIPLVYDNASAFSEGLAYFQKGDKYGFIDKAGNESLFFECESISSFKEGLAYFSNGGKYGYIDKSGNVVIDNIYEDAYYFTDGVAIVRSDGKFGCIDKKGKVIIPFEYDKIEMNGNSIYAFDDDLGEYNYICYDFEGNSAFENISNMLDKSYTFKFQVENQDIICVSKDGKYGLMNNKYELVTPLKYDHIYYTGDEEVIRFENGNLDGYILLEDYSELILDDDDVEYYNYAYGMLVVKKGERFGLYDKEGKELVPVGEFDGIEILSEKLLDLNKDSKSYLGNINGEFLSDKPYDELYTLESGIVFKDNKKIGFMNEFGEEVIPAKYSNIVWSSLLGDNYLLMAEHETATKLSLIATGENKAVDVSKFVLKNQITPKIKIYNDEIIKNNTKTDEENSSNLYSYWLYYDCFRLFTVDGYNQPVLWHYNSEIRQSGFPLSTSGFYTIENNKFKSIFTVEECGGSMRGEYAQLYFDEKSGKILLGTGGAYGGFGGFAVVKTVVKDKTGDNDLDFMIMSQPLRYYEYDEEFLVNNANLFYDEGIVLYTAENILENLEEGNAYTYNINDEIYSRDEYEVVNKRYSLIALNDIN